MSQTVDPKLAELARRLLDRTRDGRIHWNVTDADDLYAAPLTHGSALIGRLEDGSCRFAALNDDGVMLEQMILRNVDSYGFADDHYEVASTLVDLFESARRDALDVDRGLESLLSELE